MREKQVIESLGECLEALSDEHRDLYGAAVNILEMPPDPLTFYRSFVGQNKPCIIQGALEGWPALRSWNAAFLKEKLADQLIPVAATPDGRADAPANMPETGEEVFALPAYAGVTISALLDNLSAPEEQKSWENVLYMQQQDDCLRGAFSKLHLDIQPELSWADKAFGERPEAINLWIGNCQSRTTFHKDPYENLFAVIRGSKTFHLLPPCDSYRLACKTLPVAQYQCSSSTDNLACCQLKLTKLADSKPVQWTSVEPMSRAPGESTIYPGLDPSYPPPIVVTIHPGEVLYLPSLWHHFVEQDVDSDGVCIAVNFWYDMAIDVKSAYYHFAERVGEICRQ